MRKELLSYQDLHDIGLVSSRSDLARKQKQLGFPMGSKPNGKQQARRYYERVQVMRWAQMHDMQHLFVETTAAPIPVMRRLTTIWDNEPANDDVRHLRLADGHIITVEAKKGCG